MADNPAALSSPPARAGMTAWTTWANGRGGLTGAATLGRRRAGGARPGAPLRCTEQPGAARNRWPEADRGGAGQRRSGEWPGQGALAPGAAGAPRIRWPAAGWGGEGWRRGGAQPGRRRVGPGFAGQLKTTGGFGGRTKKKLRLSKEQYGFLEDSFKEHSTLTPRQNSDLASRLNLGPRQVAIWFQNRRAR
ncbi:homeobox-leucine zipper protein HOX27-like [Miscanthus floridulus]|uniref:homeobox-leucine zipper protein HOX27-like n=1 Tax=Miscanthus floridulus TaxID=154761 RepID=UPI00345A2889